MSDFLLSNGNITACNKNGDKSKLKCNCGQAGQGPVWSSRLIFHFANKKTEELAQLGRQW